MKNQPNQLYTKKKNNENCNDPNCAVHNRLTTHGRVFVGTVTQAKMHRTATIEWQIWRYIPKYERFEKRKTKVKAHNPDCINATRGDKVTLNECRPLSKTKNFVIMKVHAKDIAFLEKEDIKEKISLSKREEKNEAVES